MPRMTGIQAAAELQKRKPELRIVMLSMHDSEQFLFEALKAGASGYVLKSGADTDIVDAVRAAMRGDSFLYPSAVTTLVRDYVEHGGRGEAQFDVLTPRELEVLKLIAEAHTSKEIADAALHQHQDRRAPPPEHPRQARHARPCRADALRDPPRTDPTLGFQLAPSESASSAPRPRAGSGDKRPSASSCQGD